MPNVLLITDSPRVKKIFEAVDATGIVQLRTVATLPQADHEIAASLPAITVIQSRISGVSSDLVLLHLKKALPEGSRIVLLTAQPEEIAAATRQGVPHLDLNLSDEEFTGAIHDALSGVFAPVTPQAAAQETVAAPEPAEPPKETVETERVTLSGKGPQPQGPEDENAPSPPPQRSFEELLQGKEEDSAAYELPAMGGEFAYGPSVEEALRSVEEEKPRSFRGPLIALGVVAALVCVYGLTKSHHKKEAALSPPPIAKPEAPTPKQAAKKHPAQPPAHKEVTHPAVATAPKTVATKPPAVPPPAPAPVVAAAPKQAAPKAQAPNPLADAAARKTVPAATPQAKAPVPAAKAAPPQAPKEVAKAVPALQPKVAAPQPAAPQGRQPTPLAIVSSATLDPAYGKTHPGWERYVGSAAEFKVFREGARIKALQVVGKGEGIGHPLLKQVLREFAGIDGYRVKARETKENFLVERGEADKGVAVTVYRKKPDLRMKALVLYYR